ncbi:MAG: helix-turn-helix transcriptional regulator [Gemmatimonadetes bacterium]|nr:helix-turn-helix transcriptional regulator [Gemmatimonadota bacterium]
MNTPIDPARVAQLLNLSPAESRVVALLADGFSVREIAEIIERQPGTVYWHLKRIYKRLGLYRQVDLVLLVLTRLNRG